MGFIKLKYSLQEYLKELENGTLSQCTVMWLFGGMII